MIVDSTHTITQVHLTEYQKQMLAWKHKEDKLFYYLFAALAFTTGIAAGLMMFK
jgi:hypothetical protein